MTEAESLLDKLQKAKGPSHELDRALDDFLDPQQKGALRPVTASIDMALAMVADKLPGWMWAVSEGAGCALRKPYAEPFPRPPRWPFLWVEGKGATPPLSICIALMKGLIEGG